MPNVDNHVTVRTQIGALLEQGSTLEQIRDELDEMIYWHRKGYNAGQVPYVTIRREMHPPRIDDAATWSPERFRGAH